MARTPFDGLLGEAVGTAGAAGGQQNVGGDGGGAAAADSGDMPATQAAAAQHGSWPARRRGRAWADVDHGEAPEMQASTWGPCRPKAKGSARVSPWRHGDSSDSSLHEPWQKSPKTGDTGGVEQQPQPQQPAESSGESAADKLLMQLRAQTADISTSR